MVRQWQNLFYGQRYSATVLNDAVDFVKLAEAYGADGYRIEKPEDLLPVLKKALDSPNPAFVDVRVEREEKCLSYRSGRRGPGRNAAGLGGGRENEKTCSFRAG